MSHAFIRREIRALEARGLTIVRASIRAAEPDLPDPADREEAAVTEVILGRGIPGLLLALVRCLSRPGRFLRACAETFRLGWRSEAGLARHIAYLGEAAVVLHIAARTGCEHVHAHFGTNPAAVALLCRALGGPPFSMTLHGPDEFDRVGGLGIRRKTAAAAFSVAISHFGRAQLQRHSAQSCWSRLRIVHCGLPEELLTHQPTPVPDTDSLLFLGRLAPQKDPLLLVEALDLLRVRGHKARVHFAGDGPLRATLVEDVERRGLQGQCSFHGAVSQDEAMRLLERSRGLVLPSSAEGLPVVLMEALARGRPVVTTHVAGIPELVRDGVDGWLTPTGDAELLADSLEALLTTPCNALTGMGAVGRARVLERHDVRRSAALLHDAFASAVGR